jgi:hypothetical protein
LPKGALREPAETALHVLENRTVPVQTEPIVHWPDGSVKWLLADFVLPAGIELQSHWTLELTPARHTSAVPPELQLRETAGQYSISTGTHDFTIPVNELRPFSAVGAAMTTNGPSFASEIVLIDGRGRLHRPRLDRWRLEAAGPVRLTIAATGHFPGMRNVRLELRQSFFSGTGLVRAEVTLHNPRRARHRGGLWDLGDRGSVMFQDLSFHLSLPDGPRTLAWSTDSGGVCEQADAVDFSLYQDSSGGEHWDSQNHVNRSGRIATSFRGYRLAVGDRRTTGNRAQPVLCVSAAGATVTAAVPEFWQQFPKAIVAERNHLRIGLFPHEHRDAFELQGGEQKTHVFWLRFDNAKNDDPAANCRAMAWVHAPIRVRPNVDWCEASGALPMLNLPASRSLEYLDKLLAEARSGPASLATLRERADEFGWRNYGDVFADHELLHYHGPRPLVSHYNNQFDMVQGFLLHDLRTGDRSWWEWGDALARHVADIDIYHTTEDKAAYNGGLFWFTDHYLHAHTSTHRTYSRHNRRSPRQSYGGGPGPEHNFTTGLLLHYCLTGNRASRVAVISLANWVIAMDDGRQTIFGILDEGPTGRASMAGAGVAHGLGRAAGNSVNALLDAWVLTRRNEYLAYAESLIRRCIHPQDNVAARKLLDVEKHWSYTVFLSSLAKYLDLKAEADQFDDMYDYTQISLVHYAEWMLEHERPYFDQAEKLEFPTEAWAAQEFRKANVLRLAARYVDEPWRTQFFDRGDELADRAWSDLHRFSSRTTARAIAVLMTEGLKECALRMRLPSVPPRAQENTDFGEPIAFVPQRARIRHAASSFSGLAKLSGRLANPLRWTRYWRRAQNNDSAAD